MQQVKKSFLKEGMEASKTNQTRLSHCPQSGKPLCSFNQFAIVVSYIATENAIL